MEKKKAKKSRRELSTTTTAYIAGGLVLVVLMTLLGISAFLRVNKIVVSGVILYTPEQVAEASGMLRGANLLYFSKETVSKRIIAELPFINSVTIMRQFPDTLLIEVSESRAIAYIQKQGSAIVMDSTGKVLDSISVAGGGMVQVGGEKLIEVRGVPINEAELGSVPVIEKGYEQSYEAMKDILAAMEVEGIAKEVDYLDVTNITNISFSYKDTFRVRLGGIRDLRNKLSRLTVAVANVEAGYPNTRGALDISNPLADPTFLPD